MKYKKHIGMMISCIYLMKKALYNTQEQHQQKKKHTTTHNNRANTYCFHC